ncbi:hypothetical protein RQ831_18385 [Roseomonas gilardii]|uniref:Uncharacterized protein n=1 Tax=Roseomonas gilardii TaxID=257708 RepID=A0ABU3ML24_9PROT|nr:hypothetical protein [Roseomonas gilardii]MDT8333025.1 hypothetical protein [Roseomonas gilardii]
MMRIYISNNALSSLLLIAALEVVALLGTSALMCFTAFSVPPAWGMALIISVLLKLAVTMAYSLYAEID